MIPAFGSGWLTLLYKELLRFWKVSFQTILAPVLTALLYLLIFSHVLESRVSVFDGRVAYTAFLIPGLVMMSVLQNAFANSSSSLIQSKITGNLIFVLLPPLSPLDLFGAYVVGARICLARQHDPRRDGLACRHLGGQVRSARRVPEFPDHAADVFVRRFLFDPYATAVLANAVAFQSVLLYDRRLSLRLFRAFRYRAGLEPGGDCRVLRRAERVDALGAQARL